ncbi:MAG: GNAT family N-acetyltransferase [Paenibacillaceae bacterium]|nr:GNAT family N-acetyltransferase [Paenibacillaceae bacterium]
MHIRLLEQGDQAAVEAIMREHPLQFPPFIIAKYEPRWHLFINASAADAGYNRCVYYVAVAPDSGDLIGHAGCIWNEAVDRYEIVGVVVAGSGQRQGVRKALIAQVCGWIEATGSDTAILYTLGHPGNVGTLAFYRDIGFVCSQVEQDFFAPNRHRVTFVKPLGPSN